MKAGKKKQSIFAYLGKFKWSIVLWSLLNILSTGFSTILTLVLAQALVKITETDFYGAILILLLSVALEVVVRLMNFISNAVYFRLSNQIVFEMNSDLAKQAFKLNSKTYNDHGTGIFVQRIVDDPAQIMSNLADVIELVLEIISSFVILIYIMTLNLWVALAMVVIAAVAGTIQYFKVKKSRKNFSKVREKKDVVHSLTTEIVRSEKDVKSLGLEDKLSEYSKMCYKDYQNAQYKYNAVNNIFWFSRDIFVQVGILLTLVLGIWLVDEGLMTLAAFMIVYSNRDALWDVVFDIASIADSLTTIAVCHKRIFSLFDENEFVTETFGNVTLENVVGNIEFKDVEYTFREWEYPKENKKPKRRKKQNNKNCENENKTGVLNCDIQPAKILKSESKIFDKLSFKIKPNTTVAFVGKSGSGKSTILNLMSKMYEADSGQVLIDGVDIKKLSKETLRSTISLVNQFPYIFDMSIKDNLLLAKKDATDEEIEDAIKKAALQDFIANLPDGINTKVGESGIKLSGGQKQRLAIARALLRNSAIIIFDESTSSLDNFAQNEVKRSIDGLKGKSTIVIVAHRLSTIKDVDHIFFLDDGKIVDEGTFNKLLKRNQKFKAMFLAEDILHDQNQIENDLTEPEFQDDED